MEQRPTGGDPGTEAVRPLSDYFLVIIRRRRLILLNVFAVAVITAIVSLILPSWYTSTGSILPSESGRSNVGIMSMIESTFPLLGIPGVSAPSEAMLAILTSRRIAEQVIDANDLTSIYRSRNLDDAVRTLGKRTRIDVTENGVLRVVAEARDTERAAAIATSYITSLERYNQEVRTTSGRRMREFVELRIAETAVALVDAEERLADFQTEHASVEIGEQARAAITVLAGAEAEVMASQIQLGILRSYANENHPSVVELETRIREQQRVLVSLRAGDGSGSPGASPSLGELPELGLELVRLTRAVEVQSGVFYLLSQELESAKIQEARDTPTVQILDTPRPADRRTRPQRKLMVIIGGLVGLLAGVTMVLVSEFFATADEAHPAKRNVNAALSALREDAARLRGR
ncbi:hypothetical protein K8S17_04690 [bacterium]|nr:hypothetical protein [bacterium]